MSSLTHPSGVPLVVPEHRCQSDDAFDDQETILGEFGPSIRGVVLEAEVDLIAEEDRERA